MPGRLPSSAGGMVVGADRAGRLVGRHRLDHAALRRQLAEPAAAPPPRPGRSPCGPTSSSSSPRRPAQRRVGAQPLRRSRRGRWCRTPATRWSTYSSASRATCSSPVSVQVVGGAVGGGVHPDQAGVDLVAAGQPAQAGPVGRPAVRQHLGGQHLAVAGRRPGAPRRRSSGRGRRVNAGRRRPGGPAGSSGSLVPVGEVAVEERHRGLDQPPHRHPAGRDPGPVPVGDLLQRRAGSRPSRAR